MKLLLESFLLDLFNEEKECVSRFLKFFQLVLLNFCLLQSVSIAIPI